MILTYESTESLMFDKWATMQTCCTRQPVPVSTIPVRANGAAREILPGSA